MTALACGQRCRTGNARCVNRRDEYREALLKCGTVEITVMEDRQVEHGQLPELLLMRISQRFVVVRNAPTLQLHRRELARKEPVDGEA